MLFLGATVLSRLLGMLGTAADSTTGGEKIVSKEQAETAKALTGYCAYLVRLWQDSPYTPWRASAQSVQSGETVRFADIEQLFAFLRTQMTQGSATAASTPDDTPDVNRGYR